MWLAEEASLLVRLLARLSLWLRAGLNAAGVTAHRRQTLALGLLGLVALSLSLVAAGCDDSGASSSGLSIARGTPQPTPAHLMATVCLDRTPSYPRSDLDGAKNAVADAIVARASSPQQGATVYITLIGANSYAPVSTVQTISLDAVPPYPVLSPQGSPTEGNIFTQHATATAQATATLAAYAPTVAAQQAKLQAVQSEAAKQASSLRNLNPPTQGPTDIYGCISRAAERFSQAGSDDHKVLIIASDMEQAGSQQMTWQYPLSSVDVRVIYFECQQARACATNKDDWTRTLKDMQAANVTFTDPGAPHDALVSSLFA